LSTDENVDLRMPAARERAADPVEHAAPRGRACRHRQIGWSDTGKMRGEGFCQRDRVGFEILIHGEITAL
jgi:hypothetical protein